jgi:hypothetical protein
MVPFHYNYVDDGEPTFHIRIDTQCIPFTTIRTNTVYSGTARTYSALQRVNAIHSAGKLIMSGYNVDIFAWIMTIMQVG